MENVRDYVSIIKLNKEKDTKALEQGIGCIFKKEGALSAYYYNGNHSMFYKILIIYPCYSRAGRNLANKLLVILSGT